MYKVAVIEFDPPKISNLLSSYFLLTAYLSARKLAIAKKISQLTLVFWLPCAGDRWNVKNFCGDKLMSTLLAENRQKRRGQYNRTVPMIFPH